MRSKEQKQFIALCEKHGGPLKKQGLKPYEFTCLCPSAHKDKSPSFKFCKSSLKFYCFGCGFNGKGLVDLKLGLESKI